MVEALLMVAISAPLVCISRASLSRPRSHGFYRFFAWECMLALFLLNVRVWFDHPFSMHQIASWILLTASIPLALPGVSALVRKGKPNREPRDEPLLAFEKTTVLVTDGIYHYVRHPLYSSLLFLNWGIFFKDLSLAGALLALAASVFLVLTARAEEREDISYFGEEYREYMTRSKMFVPYIL